jgi:RNA polymerase sigma-70 factor, ECF subfamily
MVRCQLRLKAYIRSMIPDWNVADDVLQETNVVLWRKAEQFEPGTSFEAWAMKTAHFQVLAHRLKHRRQRTCFDASLVDQLADARPVQCDDLDLRLEAMRTCLQKLPQGQRDMIYSRYSLGFDSNAIAAQTRRSARAVRVTLHRIRMALLDCIKTQMKGAVAR